MYNKNRQKAGTTKRTMGLEDVKTFLRLIIQTVIFSKEIVHVQKVIVGHVFN